MDIQKILSACDHTLLLQPSTWEEIKGICDDARKYRTASICIPPCYVKKAKEYVGDEVKICTAYKMADGTVSDLPPLSAHEYEGVTPVYESMPGWKESTFGVTEWDKLPVNAQNYIRRLEELSGAKVAILSTGPERDQTIYLDDPFAD